MCWLLKIVFVNPIYQNNKTFSTTNKENNLAYLSLKPSRGRNDNTRSLLLLNKPRLTDELYFRNQNEPYIRN